MHSKHLFLIGLFRRRLEYPALKRAVREQQNLFNASVVLIEDKATGQPSEQTSQAMSLASTLVVEFSRGSAV